MLHHLVVNFDFWMSFSLMPNESRKMASVYLGFFLCCLVNFVVKYVILMVKNRFESKIIHFICKNWEKSIFFFLKNGKIEICHYSIG